MLTDAEKYRIIASLSRLRYVDLKARLRQRELPIGGSKQNLMDRIIQSYQIGVESISVQDRKFARVFSQWLLQPKSKHLRKAMAVGHSNEPVMLLTLS